MGKISTYPEASSAASDDYLLLDGSTNGTRKIKPGNVGVMLDPTLTDPDKAAPAKIVGDKNKEFAADFNDVINAHFIRVDIGTSTKITSRGIANSGGIVYDAEKTLYRYQVAEGDLLYLYLTSNSGASSAVWVFKSGDDMSTTNVGDVHFDAIDGFVRVPTGANYIAVAQSSNSTAFKVQKIIPKDYQSVINRITYGAYETIKGDFEIGSILNGVNSTTTNRIRSISPTTYDRDVFIFVKPEFKYYVAFYSDVQGTTYLYTRGVVTNEMPIIIKANTYFRFVIYKTVEETVTDIDLYKNAIYVTTQLFNNPQIYKNPLVRQAAHQGLSSNPAATTGYNLVESYINAALAGFTHGECDIVFSSDGVPFCCHDATFVDATSGQTITISEKTATELITYNYHGSTISSFEDVVKTCKTYGMGIYIDHLDGSWTQMHWDALFDVVQKYGMAKNAFWLLPAVSDLLTVPIKTWYEDANFVRVFTSAPTDLETTVNWLTPLKTSANIVSIDLPKTGVSAADMPNYTSQVPPEIEIEIWTIDNITDWEAYIPYVSGITSNRLCSNIVRKLI